MSHLSFFNFLFSQQERTLCLSATAVDMMRRQASLGRLRPLMELFVYFMPYCTKPKDVGHAVELFLETGSNRSGGRKEEYAILGSLRFYALISIHLTS